MPFQKVQPEKLAGAVIHQIEGLILRGILRPGQRLPAERELAERLGVSRPSLRAALAELQARGLLAARAGAGVFVAEVLGSAFSPALIGLFSTHDEAVHDTLAFRRDIEGLAAARAARAGTSSDLALIGGLWAQMQAAHAGADPEREAQVDTDFHFAIVEASHNVVMLHMMRSLYDLLRKGVFYNRQALFAARTTRDELLAQHGAINGAIQAGDPGAAQAAVEAHIDFISATLRALEKAEHNESFARRRLGRDG